MLMKYTSVAGKNVLLYGGKDCWFLHSDEAQYSLDGHTGPEALDLILGVKGAIYGLPMGRRIQFAKNNFINKELRQWLAQTGSGCGSPPLY